MKISLFYLGYTKKRSSIYNPKHASSIKPSSIN